MACLHLTKAVSHLKVLRLSTTNLADDQVLLNHSFHKTLKTQTEAIFVALNESRRISTLSLRRSQLAHLALPLFVHGVVHLEEVDLGLTLISTSQVSKSCIVKHQMRSNYYFPQLVGLFYALARTTTKLQKLDLTGLNLSQLDASLLAEGLAGRSEVKSFLKSFFKIKS